MGGKIESIKVDSQVLSLANCMGVLSSTEKMKTGRQACLLGE